MRSGTCLITLMITYLSRQGHNVSKRRVDRLMSDLGMNGRVRDCGVRTTWHDRNAQRVPGLLARLHRAGADPRWVADFTYVRTWVGFVA